MSNLVRHSELRVPAGPGRRDPSQIAPSEGLDGLGRARRASGPRRGACQASSRGGSRGGLRAASARRIRPRLRPIDSAKGPLKAGVGSIWDALPSSARPLACARFMFSSACSAKARARPFLL